MLYRQLVTLKVLFTEFKFYFSLSGQDPDTFFSSHNKQVQNTNDAVTANEPDNEEEPLRHSYGQGNFLTL